MTGVTEAWSAIIPLKPPGHRKTRLAGRLTAAQRDRLALGMFNHVAAVLRATPAIQDIAVLTTSAPPGWTGRLIADQGRGLNAELRAGATSRQTANLLVIHADLPLLTPADILDLIATHPPNAAIAPDRHGTGTNALALRDEAGFAFAFGTFSFTRHSASGHNPFQIVDRIGLCLDIDTPEDLDLAASPRPGYLPNLQCIL